MKKLSLLLLLSAANALHASENEQHMYAGPSMPKTRPTKKPKSIGTVNREGMLSNDRGFYTVSPATTDMLQEQDATTELKVTISDLWGEVEENQTDPETAAKAQTLFDAITTIFPGYDETAHIDPTTWNKCANVVEICSLALNTALKSGAQPQSLESLKATLEHLKLHAVSRHNASVALNECLATCHAFLPDLQIIPGVGEGFLE